MLYRFVQKYRVPLNPPVYHRFPWNGYLGYKPPFQTNPHGVLSEIVGQVLKTIENEEDESELQDGACYTFPQNMFSTGVRDLRGEKSD